MIRFIDIRGQGTGYKFAFWDTVTDKFIEVGPDQAWDSLGDLKEGLTLYVNINGFADRLLGLCPDWVTDHDGLATNV